MHRETRVALGQQARRKLRGDELALGPALPEKAAELRGGSKASHPGKSRRVYWEEEWTDTPIFDGPALAAGAQIEGPAIIEHPGTTIALPPGARAAVDDAGHTHIQLPESGPGGQGKRKSA